MRLRKQQGWLLVCVMSLTFCVGGCFVNPPFQFKTGDLQIEKRENEPTETYDLQIKTVDSNLQPITIRFMQKPKRVVVDRSENLETLLWFGESGRIVWASIRDDNVSWNGLMESYSKEMRNIPGLFATDMTLEQVIMSEPDFIVGWHSTFSRSRLRSTQWWNQRGTNTYIAETSNSVLKEAKIEDELRYLKDMGKIFVHEEMVEEYIERVHNVLREERPKRRTPSRVVVLELLGKELRNYNRTRLVGQIVEKMGGRLIFEQKTIALESLVAEDPDVIFVVYLFERDKERLRHLFGKAALNSLSAIRNKRIYLLQLDYIYSPGVKLLDGIRMVEDGLYPELNLHTCERLL